MFREFLVYNHSSLEYRAKIITLLVSANGDISECEMQKLKEIAADVYGADTDRAELLLDTIKEYHEKILTRNGLDFEHLIESVVRETKTARRFASKINVSHLKALHLCTEDEEEVMYQERILEFLENLKEEHTAKA
jgi:uncharacterized tellurite resistance protein B-like protein